MRRAIVTACVLAMMAGGVRAQTSSPHSPTVNSSSKVHKTDKTTAAKKNKKKRTTSKTTQKAEAPAQLPAQTMPPVPATLMNSPPVKPNVTMQGGLLTIDAPNSALSDVLSGVQKATGAHVEGASPTERVAVRLGPGEPDQVIAALLRGTPYDYVILGSLGQKDVVTRVLLTQSSTSSPAPASAPASAGSDTEPEQEPDVSSPVAPGRRTGVSPHQPQMGNAQDVAPQPNTESEQPQAQPPQPQAQPPAQSQQDQLLKQLQQLGLAAPKPTQ
jgi:hypothetical protein